MHRKEVPHELKARLQKVGSITILTGAGVSQESGLRTFREAQTGHWAEYRPEDLATPEAFQRDPKLVWDWYAVRRERLDQVDPNPGHYALVRMAGCTSEFNLITQNVDGLHQKAGSRSVIELHGSIHRVRCSKCGSQVQTRDDEQESVPRCLECGGFLRPDVVWFGESLAQEALSAAVEAARGCQVFFSIGTSGVVQPAASLAFAAMNSGAILVEINAEPTPLTPICDYPIHGKSGEILPNLVEDVWGM